MAEEGIVGDVADTAGTRVIAGFWRRVLGAAIDSIILGLFGGILGLFFFDPLMHLGLWGRAIGFVIALAYFGSMNSCLFGGQTIGKRAARTRVVDSGGETLGLARAALRYVILGAPFFLNGVLIVTSKNSILPAYILGIVVFGGIFGTIYLIVFNRKTRQGIHDLVIGSYVVICGNEGKRKPSIWWGHYMVVGLIFLLCIVSPFVIKNAFGGVKFAEMGTVYREILDQPEVVKATVFDGQSIFWDSRNGKGVAHYVSSTAHLNQRPGNIDSEADKIARIIFQDYPAARLRDRVLIMVNYGYDIGISSWSISKQFSYTPQEWEGRIHAFSDLGLMPDRRTP
jgi:uncharacterized RDD family membrane protein YckC